MLTGSIDAWKDFRFCEIFGGGGDAFYKFTPMNQIPLWSENIITITEEAVQGGLGSGKTGGSEGISNSHVTHEMALN